jgi:LPS-assembly protein
LIDPNSGDEQLRFTLGERFYFKPQQVSLTSQLRDSTRSDVLAAVTGQITRHWYTDLGTQYSLENDQVERSSVVVRYQPEPGKVVNFGYRFTRDMLEQIDFSTEWPIRGRWTGLARYNYSLQDRSLLEGLLGVEYNAGCWAARLVLHRFASATQEYVNSMFFQLELTGVSRIGSSPLETLRQNITGYEKTNDRPREDFNPFPAY